uniref:Uncharacterized protein n=1 Tax=Picea sitchensis TaxID=3332 RepID=A9NMC0_PICSI|nr:unknown [Picea sitchensis]
MQSCARLFKINSRTRPRLRINRKRRNREVIAVVMRMTIQRWLREKSRTRILRLGTNRMIRNRADRKMMGKQRKTHYSLSGHCLR